MAIYDVYGNVVQAADSVKDLYSENPSFYRFATFSGTQQGGCTDGEYIYYIIISTNTLGKLNIATGEKTTITYDSGLYGHGNDMAYNPVTGKVYIVTMTDGVIRQINPSTLADEGQIIPVDGSGNVIPSSGLAYDRKNNRYIISNSHNYTILDSSWNFIKTFSYNPGSKWTYQGLETDGTYIFRPLFASGSSENNILVLDMDGKMVMQIVLPVLANSEIESVANDWNGAWYAIYNGGVYLMGLPRYANNHAVEIANKIMSQS